MEEYRPAELTPEALAALQHLERTLSVTLVAYEPAPEASRPAPKPAEPLEPRH